MLRRLSLVLLLVSATACSQRAPWRVVPIASAAPPEAARPVSTGTEATISVRRTSAATDAAALTHLRSLAFPIADIDSTRLDDSFDQLRDGGARRHNAIDIMAPRGSAVLSVQDGRILKLSRSAKGGITVYATDLDEQFVYYYAHLDRYHANVYDGKPLLRGDTLGFVGTTGNSPANLPHLHFQVMRMPANRQFWNGEPVNPYPLLRAATSSDDR